MSDDAVRSLLAGGLTDEALAEDLAKVAEDFRYFNTSYRTALLREAARRLSVGAGKGG